MAVSCSTRVTTRKSRIALGIPVLVVVMVSLVAGTTHGYNLFRSWPDFMLRSYPRINPPKKAVVRLVAGSDENVSGTLSMTTVSYPRQAVLIQGTIIGLKPGKHGFHIHMNGELGNQCKDAGGHFNPSGADHASPVDSERHAGDLGNILTPPYGAVTHVSMIDAVISLGDGGDNDIAGRAVVVHAGEDDLGQGGDAESKKTGNAGSRLACGVIKLLN